MYVCDMCVCVYARAQALQMISIQFRYKADLTHTFIKTLFQNSAKLV